MLEHHGARWGDKVRIIGISIDKSPEAVVKHVEAKGWNKVEHFHRAGSSADDDYGVQGVPHVVLIDTEGKIAFVGHPAEIDLEQGIEKLLKGQTLGGGAGGEDGEDEGDYSEMDVSKVLTEMDSYQSKLDGLKGVNATGLVRDFVVLIRETQANPATGKQLTSYKNINVLVGPAAAVETAKTEVQKFLTSFGGSFKSEWKTQAM